MDQEPIDRGRAGASARREHERRKAQREAAVRAKHPHIGELLLALQQAPAEERSWEVGAAGEERIEQLLAKRCPEVVVLHDRAVPGSRANIDHIAICRSGVWVIDAKRYKGRIRVVKPWFAAEKLKVAGWDRTKLVEALTAQVELVKSPANAAVPAAEVRGALCFVGGDLPLLRTLSINGFPLFYPRSLARRLNSRGPLTSDEIGTLASTLAGAFPAR